MRYGTDNKKKRRKLVLKQPRAEHSKRTWKRIKLIKQVA